MQSLVRYYSYNSVILFVFLHRGTVYLSVKVYLCLQYCFLLYYYNIIMIMCGITFAVTIIFRYQLECQLVKPGMCWPTGQRIPGFLKLLLCRRLYVCLHVCVCLSLRLLIISSVIWHDMDPCVQLKKFYNVYMAAIVGIISRRSL